MASHASLSPAQHLAAYGDHGHDTAPCAGLAPLINCGLNGVTWANAFDLEAGSGPPGMRLHAILSVWQI